MASQQHSKTGAAPVYDILSEAREDRRQAVVDLHIKMLQVSLPATMPAPSPEQQVMLDSLFTVYADASRDDLYVDGRFAPWRAVILTVEARFESCDGMYRKHWRHAQARFRQAWEAVPLRAAEQQYDELTLDGLAGRLLYSTSA